MEYLASLVHFVQVQMCHYMLNYLQKPFLGAQSTQFEGIPKFLPPRLIRVFDMLQRTMNNTHSQKFNQESNFSMLSHFLSNFPGLMDSHREKHFTGTLFTLRIFVQSIPTLQNYFQVGYSKSCCFKSFKKPLKIITIVS